MFRSYFEVPKSFLWSIRKDNQILGVSIDVKPGSVLLCQSPQTLGLLGYIELLKCQNTFTRAEQLDYVPMFNI